MAGKQLQIICVDLLGDQVPDRGGLPPSRYVVMLGLSRAMTVHEMRVLEDDRANGELKPTEDRMWLKIEDTYLEAVENHMPHYQSILSRAADAASVLEFADVTIADALTEGYRVEMLRRIELRNEITRRLRRDFGLSH